MLFTVRNKSYVATLHTLTHAHKHTVCVCTHAHTLTLFYSTVWYIVLVLGGLRFVCTSFITSAGLHISFALCVSYTIAQVNGKLM